MKNRNLLAGLSLAGFVISAVASQAGAVCSFSSKHDSANHKVVITLADVLPSHLVRHYQDWVSVDWTGIQLDHHKTSESDKPALPYLTYWISVPGDAEVLSVKLKGETAEEALPAPVVPVQRPYVPETTAAPPALTADPGIYKSREVYPPDDFAYAFIRRGSTRILELKVYVCKYRGMNHKLIFCLNPKITLELDADSWNPAPQPRNAMDAELKRKLANPREAFFGQHDAH